MTAGSVGYGCTGAAADSKPDVFWARPAVKIGCIAPAASLFLPITCTGETNETEASLLTFTFELHGLDTSGKPRGWKVDGIAQQHYCLWLVDALYMLSIFGLPLALSCGARQN